MNFGKLSAKKESEICLSCGECCKRYWITVLPEESKKISKTLKKKEKDFLGKDCFLLIKLYPKSVKGVLTFPTTFFPKRIVEEIKNEMIDVPQSFFIVPQVVLKREGTEKKACAFLSEDNKCKIYSSRPQPCKLFPFIAVEGLRESYPFCELFKVTYRDLSKESRNYFKKVKKYFDSVDKKGFSKIWKNPPKKGYLYLNETKLCEIEVDELEKMISAKQRK